MKISKPSRLLAAGLCALLAAGGLNHSSGVSAAEPASPALRQNADALIARLAQYTRSVRQVIGQIGKNSARLTSIEAAELPKLRLEHERLKAAADAFDAEWRKKFAGPCSQDFRDQEQYTHWLRLCRRQLAREDAVGAKLQHAAQAYTKLAGERRQLAAQNVQLARLQETRQAALDTVLLELVANPLLLGCGHCLRDIKNTLEVGECYQTCWRQPPGK
jgi:hypothetical protein